MLADGWGFDVASIRYAPVGAGSYHWVVEDGTRARGFVTVDDLDAKPWLGDTRETVFDGLARAFATACALRDAGLELVVAPIPANGGETVRRWGPRHTIALFPFIDGEAGEFGPHAGPGERGAVVAMLAELHRATTAAGSLPPPVGLELPGRRLLEAALRDVGEPWPGGPFSEPARHALADHAGDAVELVALADRLAADVAGRGAPWVVTHGEPHSGNVLRTGESHVLVDWDTVALAPPERDLWMVLGEAADGADAYEAATGRPVDETAVSFFRLAWDLKDLAGYLDALRAPHGRTEDTETAYACVLECLSSRGRWAAFL